MLADAGNVFDALFMAARAALWDTKVPRTRPIQYHARRGGEANMDAMEVEGDPAAGTRSAFDTRDMKRAAADFELPDYWDEGEVLDGRDRWPVCVTLNLVCVRQLRGICFELSDHGRRLYSFHPYTFWMQHRLRKHPHLSSSCWRLRFRRINSRVYKPCA